MSFIANNRNRLLENATEQEITVAKFLDDNRIDFFAQFPVFCKKIHTTFWCDFFIPKGRIVLEIDGTSHNRLLTRKKDTYRDAFMKEQHLTIIRLTNKDVDSGEYINALADVTNHCQMRSRVSKTENASTHIPNEKILRKNLEEILSALNSCTSKDICFLTKNRHIIRLMTNNLNTSHPLSKETLAIKNIIEEKRITIYWKYDTKNAKTWMGRHMTNKVTQLYIEASRVNAVEIKLS